MAGALSSKSPEKLMIVEPLTRLAVEPVPISILGDDIEIAA